MSRPLPCGTPSMTSKRTMSPSSFKPESNASVPPICPAPTSAILLRAIHDLLEIGGVLPGFAVAGKRVSVATVGDVILALHLDQARHRALKLEGPIALGVKRRRFRRRRG